MKSIGTLMLEIAAVAGLLISGMQECKTQRGLWTSRCSAPRLWKRLGFARAWRAERDGHTPS